MVSTAVETEGEEEQMAKSSASREQLTEEGREVERLLIKRERNRAKNGFLWNTSTESKGTTFVILKNYASALIRKERLSPTSKARMEASRNELWKRAGCQTESKALEKSIVDRIVREPGLGLLNPSKMD